MKLNRVSQRLFIYNLKCLFYFETECNFSKIGLRPPESVTVCRENCLPVNTYIDLSKIGICSQGVCCLNKIQTTGK